MRAAVAERRETRRPEPEVRVVQPDVRRGSRLDRIAELLVASVERPEVRR